MKNDNKITENKKLAEIFFPYSEKRRKSILRNNSKTPTQAINLAHYTTAENAIKILKSKEFWLRNTQLMDDFSEVKHGQSMLNSYFQGDNFKNSKLLKTALGKVNVDIEQLANFDDFWQTLESETYIACLSEHTSKDNDYGRLSMWRAFGKGTATVAFIFKFPKNETAKTSRTVLSPVLYAKNENFAEEFNRVIFNIEKNVEFLKTVDPKVILERIYWMLAMAVVSLKHPCFDEEREWRLVYLAAHFQKSNVSLETVTLSGIPQKIYKFSLQDKSEDNPNGLSLNDLIDRVIIGPTQHANSIRDSLVIEMTNAGIEKAVDKISFSNIPLR